MTRLVGFVTGAAVAVAIMLLVLGVPEVPADDRSTEPVPPAHGEESSPLAMASEPADAPLEMSVEDVDERPEQEEPAYKELAQEGSRQEEPRQQEPALAASEPEQPELPESAPDGTATDEAPSETAVAIAPPPFDEGAPDLAANDRPGSSESGDAAPAPDPVVSDPSAVADNVDAPAPADPFDEPSDQPTDEPLALPPADVADELLPDDLKWHAFWSPFRSRIAADGFVSRLEAVTGFDYRIVKVEAGNYEVAFAYDDDGQRAAILEEIEAATGLVIEGS